MEKTSSLIVASLGSLLILLAVYQAALQPQVKIIAWYDMNGDGVINQADFDLNGDGIVSWVDVKLVQDVAAEADYVQRYDFNRDGKVNQEDVEIITAWLGKGRMALYDLNGDGTVDWRDLDVNGDGKVDILDVSAVSRAYGTKIGEPHYNPRCDFNQDGVIDDLDINLVAAYFGYPLSIIDLLTPTKPLSQMFIIGIILTLLGSYSYFKRKGG